MSEAAWAFEQVPLNLTRTKPVRLAGLLEVEDELEEIQVLGEVNPSTKMKHPRVRAFRVRRDLQSVGLQKGDCLLVQPKRVAPNDLAVISTDGAFSVRRVAAVANERMRRAETSDSEATPPRVIGGFVGILRKRLAPCTHRPASSGFDLVPPSDPHVSGKMRWLRSKLGMVESTCAETTNPKLKRALQHEARSLRRQLQIEAGAK